MKFTEEEIEALRDALIIMRQKRYILKCDCDWSRLATLDKNIEVMSVLYEIAVSSKKQ